MSKRSYPVWDYPSNTKQNPIPPLKSTQGQNRGVGIPQSQQSTTTKKNFPKPETVIPMDRQLYREALEAQTAVSQNTAAKTPKQSVEKPLDRQNQENAKPADRKQKQMFPQEEQNILRQKQTVPQWKAKRPDGLRKSNGGYESEEERRQKELEEEERRREEAEEQRRWEELQEEIRKSQERLAREEEFLEMQEKQIQNYQRYLDYQEKQWQQEKRRERWEGFGEQVRDILETGKNALAGEWDKFWDDAERTEYWGKQIGKTRENISDAWNFFQNPFAALGNFFLGEASPTDSEYLQKMARQGATMYDFIKDPMPYYANYLTGEAAVTDGEGLQRAAERGKENNLLNYTRYYVDTLLGGALGAADSLFGKENGWLDRNHKGLMEEARENYDRIIDSRPPFLRKKEKSNIEDAEWWTDALLSLTGNIPGDLLEITRNFGKAKDEAERKGYSRDEQTVYALGKVLREHFLNQTDGYDLNENDRGFLKVFGDYISNQPGIIEAIESAEEKRVPDLIESILMLVEPGVDRVLNGTEEPDIKEIPDIFDDMVDNLLDRAEEKVDAWEKDAWAPKETLPEEIWGLPEYDYGDGADSGALLPAGGETDAGGLWELPEETENTGNPDENWYTGDEEKHIPPQGPLLPNTTYQAGEFGYTYQTDSQGRISDWHAEELQLTERSGRLPYVRNTPGKQPGDHAGHLAGDRFGGTGGLDNLVSQYWLVNLSSYRKLENDWNKAIQAGKTVEVDVEVVYDGDDLRPSMFIVEYTIDGETKKKYITNDFWGGLS